MTNPTQKNPLIRVKMPDPDYYSRWVDVGYVDPLDGDNKNFRLVIEDRYKKAAADKIEELVFYFDDKQAASNTNQPSSGDADMKLWGARLVYSTRWIVGGFFLLVAVAAFFDSEFSSAMFFAAVTVSLLPPVDYYVAQKGLQFKLSHRIWLVVGAFILLAFLQ